MASIHVYHEGAEKLRDAVLAKRADLDVRALTTKAAFDEAIAEAEILFAPLPPRSGWAKATRLRLVQVMGAGVDLLLPSPDLPESVVVAGVRGVFADEAAEHAVAMMLALVRNLPVLRDRQLAREWKPFASQTLSGKVCVVFGTGAIGSRVARIAEAMKMRVVGISRRQGDLDAALHDADVLCVCAPLTPATRGRIDANALARMKEGAWIVSLGRGGIIDEPALLSSLNDGRIGGAALDVFETEPLPADSPWWTAPNVILTPHVAGLGIEYVGRCIDVLLENVDRLERGDPLVNVVDRLHGY